MENNYFIDIFKISIVAFFGWVGLKIDLVPIAVYAMLWICETVTFVIKDIVLYKRLSFWNSTKRGLRHLMVLFIPLVIVLLVKNANQEYESLYKSSIFMITFYISLTTIGNVVTMFTGHEYKFESVIVRWFEKLSKIDLKDEHNAR